MKRALLLGVLSLGLLAPLTAGSQQLAAQQPPAQTPAANVPAFSTPPQSQSVDPILAISDRFESVSSKVLPAVVSVEAVKPVQSPTTGKTKTVEESGSGVIIRLNKRPGFYVLTNNHVIADAAPEQITISLADGRILRPARVWADPETDIALLSLEKETNLPDAKLGDSDNVKVGRWVLAMGSPFGLAQTVTHGIISARDRGQVHLGETIRIKDFLQTDAAINPGSSGGPLVDLYGNVIGINTAIASASGNNSGVAFSIPINLAKRVVNQMLTRGAVQRGYLGMQLAAAMEPYRALQLGLDRVQGALVERVLPNTPAAAAHVQTSDVILQVEQTPIRNENHFINMVSGLRPGQRIRLQVWRNRQLITLEAVVGDWNRSVGS